MAQDTDLMATAGEGLRGFFDMQGDAMREMLGAKGFDSLLGAGMKGGMDPAELAEWASTATQLQQLWFDFAAHQTQAAAEKAVKGSMGGSNMLDPAQWLVMSQAMLGQMPKGMFEASAKLAQDQMQLWSGVMQSFAAGATGRKMADAPEAAALPKSDRRFADQRPDVAICQLWRQ